jgi:hypothetical protein
MSGFIDFVKKGSTYLSGTVAKEYVVITEAYTSGVCTNCNYRN